jgi:hypothetical protein
MGLELETPKTIDGIDVSAWTDAQVAELRAALNDATIADQEIDQVRAEELLPANVIAAKRREAEQRQQDATDLRSFASAKKKYGEDMIGTIETRDGLIIMQTAKANELDTRDKRYSDLLKNDELAADYAWWQETKKAIVCPSDERVEAMCSKFPRLKTQIENMHTSLVNGLRTRALGK